MGKIFLRNRRIYNDDTFKKYKEVYTNNTKTVFNDYDSMRIVILLANEKKTHSAYIDVLTKQNIRYSDLIYDYKTMDPIQIPAHTDTNLPNDFIDKDCIFVFLGSNYKEKVYEESKTKPKLTRISLPGYRYDDDSVKYYDHYILESDMFDNELLLGRYITKLKKKCDNGTIKGHLVTVKQNNIITDHFYKKLSDECYIDDFEPNNIVLCVDGIHRMLIPDDP